MPKKTAKAAFIPLTLKEASRRVNELAKNNRDFEAAHVAEDALHQHALETIASEEGVKYSDAVALARIVLRTKKIKSFPRHCA